MPRDRNDIRILLLGEPNVGKTTLILSLVSEEFSPKVPAKAEEITIPADVTPERVSTQIVDYSSRTQSEEQLYAEIRRADVICLVHALDDAKSLERISSFWLPLIRHNHPNHDSYKPIVLVGNKLDLLSESKLSEVLPIMTDFSEIETCIECSAKTLLNLSETFWFAQKAVLYPTSPLYDADRKELTPSCIRALTRVFRICDTDNDGYLSDRELEAFQSRCFSVPLTTQSLQDVKQLVRQSCPGGVTLNGITQKGFLFLHLIFIQKGRHETTWTVLRQFGYDNQLRLSNDFLFPRFSVPSGCSTELSPLGMQFLHTLFNKYDLDRDGHLSPAELTELLATCPQEQLSNVCEITDSVNTNSKGWISRQGFLAYWALTAYWEPSRVLEYFAYLGFTYFAAGSFWSTATRDTTAYHTHSNGTTATAPPEHLIRDYSGDSSVVYGPLRPTCSVEVPFSPPSTSYPAPQRHNARDALLRSLIVTTEKRLDLIRQSTKRTVFYCRVYGARKVGKTCLIQGLLGRHIRGTGGSAIGGIAGRPSGWAAASGISVYGQPRTLLMHEIGAGAGEQMTAGEALLADVACLVYDVSDSESFRYVANLFLNYYRGTRVPCLFVAAKSDQPQVIQNYPVDPSELAAKYNLTPPESFSSISFEQTSLDPNVSTTVRQSLIDTMNNCSLGDKGTVITRRTGSEDPSEFARKKCDRLNDPMRVRRHSRSDLSSCNSDAQLVSEFPSVFVTLCTLANYPHLRGLQLAPTDHAWKWTLAATILAGFGFVAFRIAKTHF